MENRAYGSGTWETFEEGDPILTVLVTADQCFPWGSTDRTGMVAVNPGPLPRIGIVTVDDPDEPITRWDNRPVTQRDLIRKVVDDPGGVIDPGFTVIDNGRDIGEDPILYPIDDSNVPWLDRRVGDGLIVDLGTRRIYVPIDPHPDNEPAAPSNLAVFRTGERSVLLRWQLNADNAEWQEVDEIDLTTGVNVRYTIEKSRSEFPIQNLLYEHTYQWAVRAVNETYGVSKWSNTVMLTMPADTGWSGYNPRITTIQDTDYYQDDDGNDIARLGPSVAPVIAGTAYQGYNRISLSGGQSYRVTSQVQVLRSQDQTNWTNIGAVVFGAETFDDRHVLPEQVYYYIAAMPGNTAGEPFSYSNIISVTSASSSQGGNPDVPGFMGVRGKNIGNRFTFAAVPASGETITHTLIGSDHPRTVVDSLQIVLQDSNNTVTVTLGETAIIDTIGIDNEGLMIDLGPFVVEADVPLYVSVVNGGTDYVPSYVADVAWTR